MTKEENLQKSILIGRYVGPILVVLLASEIINFNIWSGGNSPQLNYLNGFVLLLFGFGIVSAHNVWLKGWPIIITISGWFFTLLGLYRMFFPGGQQANDSLSTSIGLFALLALEVYMTIKAYTAQS